MINIHEVNGKFKTGDLVKVASGNVYKLQTDAQIRTFGGEIVYGAYQIKNGKRFGAYRLIAETKLQAAE